MKILVIIHNQSYSGPFIKILEQCEALSSFGNEVTLLCTSPKSKLKFNSRKYNNTLIIESPDLLWGKRRQGIDIWNILNRLFFVLKHKMT